ncbi:SPOR domain-containing protein [uncultured Paracoccus sp.]|uniref:SPOR domain-containing protein n=1 Tax=uncultured Paracoccus sp. TaxID=189685 RepID=UPI0026205739|nr:SPOR domain-containing protein [uncultured Paracoccus sp.]
MTVVDFRSGGYDGAHHGAPYDDHAFSGVHAGQDWADEDWNEGRFVTDPTAPLTERDTLIGRVARLTHYLGALVSVLLMLSLVVWGYRLVVRDVSGVPVIRAVQGESRIAPDEPGGELTDRSGLAVNAIAAGAEANPTAEVAIAPAPTALAADDVPMGELGVAARETATTEEMPANPDEQASIAVADAEAAAAADRARATADAAIVEETDTALLSNAPPAEAPVNEAVTDLDGAQAQDAAITQALTEAGVETAPAALARSSRPAARPRAVATAPAADAPAPARAQAAAADVPPPPSRTRDQAADATPVETVRADDPGPVASASVSAGAPLVQIGAFDSDAIASSEWGRIASRHGSLFAGKAPVVQKHVAGGRTFWRLRVAGFDSRDDARKFCASLIETGTDCIPALAQ